METVKEQPTFKRIHFYLGPICRSEVINQKATFSANKNDILDKFGVGKRLRTDEEKQAERDKYVFKFMNGGPVESNDVLFNDDRVLILPKEKYLLQLSKDSIPDKKALLDEGKQSAPVQSYKSLSDLKLKNLQQLFKVNGVDTKTEED